MRGDRLDSLEHSRERTKSKIKKGNELLAEGHDDQGNHIEKPRGQVDPCTSTTTATRVYNACIARNCTRRLEGWELLAGSNVSNRKYFATTDDVQLPRVVSSVQGIMLYYSNTILSCYCISMLITLDTIDTIPDM